MPSNLPLISAAAGQWETALPALRIFGALALVITVSMLATSHRFYRLQRVPLIGALVSGGWLAIAVGFLLGPYALRIIETEMLFDLRPLLMIGIGWIGVIVGMQAHRELLQRVPSVIWRWSLLDALVMSALLVIPVYVVLATATARGGDEWNLAQQLPWLFVPIALLLTASFGWAPETRSIQESHEPTTVQLSLLIKGGSGVSALIAVSTFGLVFVFVGRDPQGAVRFMPLDGMSLLILTILTAAFIGLAARLFLQVAGRNRSQTLVVFLGMVGLVAGVAAELEYSALFGAMLAGVIVANLSGARLREFEWFLLKAEHVVAVFFYVLAGALLQPGIGWWGWLLVAILFASRLVIKKPMMQRLLTRETQRAGDERSGTHALIPQLADGPQHSRSTLLNSPLIMAPIRISPIAVALAVSLVLAESSPLNVRLLTIIVLLGLLSEIPPVLMSVWRVRGELGAGVSSQPDVDRGGAVQ